MTKFQCSKPVLPSNLRIPRLVNVVSKETLDDGTEVINVNQVSEEEYYSRQNLPKDEDYKLSDLLKAGVPLEDVAVAGLLDSTDFHDVSVRNEKLSQSMVDKLRYYQATHKEQIESLPTEEPTQPSPTND